MDSPLLTAGVDIGNLNFIGSGTSVSRTSGIAVHIDATGKKLSGLHIHGVEVKNYGQLGIHIRIKSTMRPMAAPMR